jgi:hypothetical protein
MLYYSWPSCACLFSRMTILHKDEISWSGVHNWSLSVENSMKSVCMVMLFDWINQIASWRQTSTREFVAICWWYRCVLPMRGGGGCSSAGWWPCPMSPRKVLITEYNMMHSAGSTRGGNGDTFHAYSMYQNDSNYYLSSWKQNHAVRIRGWAYPQRHYKQICPSFTKQEVSHRN